MNTDALFGRLEIRHPGEHADAPRSQPVDEEHPHVGVQLVRQVGLSSRNRHPFALAREKLRSLAAHPLPADHEDAVSHAGFAAKHVDGADDVPE